MGNEKVAVIGLGAMGEPITRRLLATGRELTVWNRSPAPVARLARAGAAAAASPAAAAASADIVIVMVSDSVALRAVTAGPTGLLAGLRPGAVVVQMSTVAPTDVVRLGEELPAGSELLDAPVLGSIGEARDGTLTIFAGGATSVVERTRTVLAHLGEALHVGPLGAGTAAKLVANQSLLGVLGVLGESLALAGTLGLSPDAAYDVLDRTPLAAQAHRRRLSIEEDVYPPRFRLALARKDADLIVGVARRGRLRLAEAVASWLAEAEAAGRGSQDYTALLAHIAEPAVSGGSR
ncbi:NAD(P)-dependent oxidoreductase [Nocardioides speluncae]|uniref:NAD(P)-dependent oxidoreductase n=1 Tax=Nocardioides speluncae TaxID=2670337 RepID=UPI000D68DD12|nr:NAD(P)-dependent oxidoreductase [Nocardioides speluncae]